MEQQIKKTRKSVPRPNSGRRAVDGATDLVKVGIRLTPAQHKWVKANGNDGLRRLIQERIDSGVAIPVVSSDPERVRDKVSGTDYGSLTSHQRQYWRKECDRAGIPIPEGLKD